MRRLGIGLVVLGMALAGFFASVLYFDEPLPASRVSEDAVRVGDRRPDFRLDSVSGDAVTAADFDGRVLLLNFWATWCEPCKREMPMLVELQAQFGPRGLQVLAIAVDDPLKARMFAGEYRLNYPVLAGVVDAMAVSHDYGNTQGVLPYSVLVDRKGFIRWQYIGEMGRTDIMRLLQRYL